MCLVLHRTRIVAKAEYNWVRQRAYHLQVFVRKLKLCTWSRTWLDVFAYTSTTAFSDDSLYVASSRYGSYTVAVVIIEDLWHQIFSLHRISRCKWDIVSSMHMYTSMYFSFRVRTLRVHNWLSSYMDNTRQGLILGTSSSVSCNPALLHTLRVQSPTVIPLPPPHFVAAYTPSYLRSLIQLPMWLGTGWWRN